MIALGSISELASLAWDLPASFRERAGRFGSEKRRESFLAGRVLLQMMLRRQGLAPSLPHIAVAEHGKPYFDAFKGAFFNLSHSGGIIAACMCGHEAGIDLEQSKPRHNLQGLEDRELNEDEMAFVKEDPSLELDRFTALWTLRECLVKVTGVGLAGLPRIDPRPSLHVVRAHDNPKGVVQCRLYPKLAGAVRPMWLACFGREDFGSQALWASADGFFPMDPPARSMEFSVEP
ncbi:MAG: 4'-phosphopantetheinyl transferase family protein [Succinivibrio sp.]